MDYQSDFKQYVYALKRNETLSWINAVSTEAEYDQAKGQRQPGTCTWILQTAAFLDWYQCKGTADILWINGGPGTGKTVLSASIVEFLKQNSSLPVAYFFCRDDDKDKCNTISILRSLIFQLATESAEAFKVLKDLKEGEPVESRLWEILSQILQSIPSCYLVIDGYDECSDSDTPPHRRRSGVIKFFTERLLQSTKSSSARILFVSRADVTIKTSLRLALDRLSEYTISVDDTAGDIRLFAEGIISSVDLEDITVKDKLVDQLCDSCQGMFLWARLQRDHLEHKMSAIEVENTLLSIPIGLDESYGRVLRRIAGSQTCIKNRAKNILRWVLFATRPLQVGELLHLLAVNYQGYTFDLEEISVPITDAIIDEKLLYPCKSFIEVRGSPGTAPSDKTIHLVHPSVKQFLLSEEQKKAHTDAADLFFNRRYIHHALLTKSCLCYTWLSVKHFPESQIIQYPLLGWIEHQRLSGLDKSIHFQRRLFSPGPLFEKWKRIIQVPDLKSLKPIEVARYFRLPDMQIDLNWQNSPLYIEYC